MRIGDATINRSATVALATLILLLGVGRSTAVAQDVEWTGQVNVTVSGTTLQKTSGCDGCDDAGARSLDHIDSPGGYVEFTVGDANAFWLGGLSNGNGSPSYSGIDYAVRFNGAGGADVLENGHYKGGDTSYAAGDIFRIAVAYGRVQFSRNGTVFYTSRTAPTYPLVLDVALGTIGASLYNAQLSHDLVGDPPPPPPPLTESNITWIDQANVTAGDRVLQKTDGCGGCDDAGAVSEQTLDAGDGHVEFTVGEMGTFWVAGLSNGNTDTSFGDIDFAFRFNGAGVADVLENGVYKGGDTIYTVGDVFRISVVQGHVYYRHNGEVVYASTVTPTYPLLLDTAFGSMDATIYNANLIPTSTGSGGPSGGYLLEFAGTQPTRERYNESDIASFLPPNDARGAFSFPSPYNTRGVRLTNASDCGGGDCVWYHGYSYWRRINNHRNNPTTMYIVLGLEPSRGGTGPTLFSFNKQTEEVQNLGGLFVCRPPQENADFCQERDPDGSYYRSTAEQWYFSANDETMLYAFYVGSTQLRRFHVDDAHRSFEPAPAMDLVVCRNRGNCPANANAFDHPHTSDDDLVHSANVKPDVNTSAYIGCVVYRERVDTYTYYEPEPGYAIDECALDKGGEWLVMHETKPDPNNPEQRLDDELIIKIATGESRHVDDAAGAQSSHSDLGYGYSVGPDNQNNKPNAATLMKYPIGALPGRDVLYYEYAPNDIWPPRGGGAGHVSHENAAPGNPEQQFACGSHATKGSEWGYQDEIVCFMLNPERYEPVGNPPQSPLDVLVVAPVMTDLDQDGGANSPDDYGREPKGSLDITGDYFIWTTNMAGHGHRLDAFIVKVPKDALLNGR